MTSLDLVLTGVAYAKVNIGLRVGTLREDGFHPVDGIFQSVDLADRLSLQSSDLDSIRSSHGGEVVGGLDNLAFRAVVAVRDEAGADHAVAMTLDKKIPLASGLGGGSADAAAGLAMAGRYFDRDMETLDRLAPELGSDVPFCLRGGTARVRGRGDVVEPREPLSGFAVGLVVPPFEVSTPAVFAKWDAMNGPRGPSVVALSLPPELRDEENLANDLYPATVALEPEIDEWRHELEQRWGRPVMLSGSGPTLFALFLDRVEAAEAVAIVPVGARLAEAAELSPVGWRISE
ncbi:MAG: 4-(cytidine 5'-diphospho)-2-C-methyl-D-erythritol kinase [Acidimicrobiia bacterium]|nr:4-(cytidine 5'-diphospho)-2-C-methyl-D-erythritol kinase [Acidimicrobiia bacterium]